MAQLMAVDLRNRYHHSSHPFALRETGLFSGQEKEAPYQYPVGRLSQYEALGPFWCRAPPQAQGWTLLVLMLLEDMLEKAWEDMLEKARCKGVGNLH